MKTIKISFLKVIEILKKDLVTKKDDPLEWVMYKMIKEQITKKKKEVLLKSGAKLFYDNYRKSYYIGGYAADDHDVNEYF